ncbi:hypothetical protein SAMD00019534_039980 [Acytostelium subglobosum LB1]|uniref:hypothetical protein n=1 Tax=Acytostelium subglobosum LB1 TaxID=1410327 RepID=UPI000644D7A3|nr:hypothetical protein SAMD00019534_039980 [Acytostelium subglobosum LB1]GAM20823.1 hypothetical protein SAMD00019534_039980 [Acytostelium subglobosum LB1]|eukprot:XP_012755957.1 hypothetical protein SAMD00019534_039980 [Acytostelium subglobosum LB1]
MDWLPPTLKRLTFEGFRNALITAELPSALESLSIMSDYKYGDKGKGTPIIEITGQLSDTIVELKIGYTIKGGIKPGMIPSSVTTLDLGRDGVEYTSIPPGTFPPTLISFKFDGYCRDHLFGLPSSLRRLSYCFSGTFNDPGGLTHLSSMYTGRCLKPVDHFTVQWEYSPSRDEGYTPAKTLKSLSINGKVVGYARGGAKSNRQADQKNWVEYFKYMYASWINPMLFV